MKFRVDRDVFAEAVAWAARALPSRPPMPVLAGVFCEVADSTLKLSSFDYEVSAQVSVDAEAEEPGTALVSGRLLAEISRSLPDRPVEVSTDGVKVLLTCGSARFTLLTMPVEDYPSLPDMPPATGYVGSDAFAAAVGQVAVAAGRDDTLPMLTGIRLEIEGDTVTLVATDRYRLAVRELHWKPDRPDISAVALVPARTLADTAKSLTSGAEVSIALSASGAGEGMIGFEGGSRRTTTRLLEGESFPKYTSLLPSGWESRAEVEMAPFIEAVKRVALVAERNTPVRLTFRDEEVLLEAGSGDEAQAAEVVGATLEGEEIRIAFNPSFLLDGLGALDSDVARLHFTTPTKPAVITGKPADEQAEPEYRYLLMPIRLSD